MSHQGLVHQHLTVAGDGTGASNFVGDYSVTPAYPAIYAPSSVNSYELHAMTMYVEDTGNFDSDEFAGLTLALTNGISMAVVSGTTTKFDLTLGEPMKTNGHVAHIATRADVYPARGAGTSSAAFRWDFDESLGFPLKLCGRNDHGIRITLNDDLTGLVTLEFTASGHVTQVCNGEPST